MHACMHAHHHYYLVVEQLLERPGGDGVYFGLIIHDSALQSLLGQLPRVDLFVDGTRRHEPKPRSTYADGAGEYQYVWL